MQKNKSTRSTFNFVDIVIGVCCIAGMSFCLYLFQRDMNMSLTKLGEEPVAVIYFKHNVAQRRLIDRNLWERLKQASPVYNGDRIRTASLSEAVAVFPDGTRLDLHENTLIQLFKTEKQIAVDFVSGSISANSKNAEKKENAVSLNIKAAGKTLTFAPESSVDISIPASLNSSFTPEANASSKTDSETNLAPSTIVVNVIKGDISIRDSLPSDMPTITQTKADSVASLLLSSFSPTLEKPKKDESLEKIKAAETKKEMTTGDSAIISNSNPDFVKGTRPVDALPEEARPLQVLLPANNITILRGTQSKLSNDSSVSWVWDCSDNVSTVLELSYSNDFSSPTFTQTFPKGQKLATIPIVAEDSKDTIFWRLREENNSSEKTNAAKLGSVAHGTIFIQQSPSISVEEVLTSVFTPESVGSVNVSTSKPNTRHSEAPDTTPDATPEIISETNAENLKTLPIAETNAENATIEPNAKSVAPETVSDASIKDEIQFSELKPVLTLPKNNAVFNDAYFENSLSISFKWDKLSDAVSYVFELKAKQPDGSTKTLISKTLKQNSFTLKDDSLSEIINNGGFAWSVKAINASSEETNVVTHNFTVALGEVGNVELDTSNIIDAR